MRQVTPAGLYLGARPKWVSRARGALRPLSAAKRRAVPSRRPAQRFCHRHAPQFCAYSPCHHRFVTRFHEGMTFFWKMIYSRGLSNPFCHFDWRPRAGMEKSCTEWDSEGLVRCVARMPNVLKFGFLRLVDRGRCMWFCSRVDFSAPLRSGRNDTTADIKIDLQNEMYPLKEKSRILRNEAILFGLYRWFPGAKL